MSSLLCVLALTLPTELPPTVTDSTAVELERTRVAAPPRAQESLLPAHTLSVGLSAGITASTPLGTTPGNVPFGSGSTLVDPAGSVSLDWSPLDWLQVSFLRPGLSFLLGTRGHEEVVLSAGLEGWGYHQVEGLQFQPGVRAAWRHWFSPATSLAVVGGWSAYLSFVGTGFAIDGGVLVTQRVGEVLSFNVALGANGWPGQGVGLSLGSGRLGLRTFPLMRVHLTPVWSLDLDAQVRLQVQPFVATSQQVLMGFTAAW